MQTTKIKKDKKGYSIIHRGQVLVNGLSVEDLFSIIPNLSIDELRKVSGGTTLAVHDFQKLSLRDVGNSTL